MLQKAPCRETWYGAENSETQLGKDVKYKMLVCAVKQETGEEVAQLVSESFTVTTMRSKGSVKPAIPCLTDPVDKLEGLGGKTRRNLLDVRKCVRGIDARAAVPAAAPNVITTVEHFKQLEEALRGWSSCPKQIRRALLPEAAVEHSQKVLQADSRLRSWRADPKSDWGLLYHSSQAFVEFDNPAVLVQPSGGPGGSQFVLAAHASSDQLARMNELAAEAFQRWKQADHPGWSVTEADSDTFLARLHQLKAPFTFGGQLEMSEVLQQYPGSHAASSSQELSLQQQQALELDARLGSITGRINRGHLEDQPSGLFGGAPLGPDYFGTGPSSSALGQGFQQGMFSSQQQHMGDNALLMPGVIPGVPVHPESPGPSMSGQGRGHQPLMPSMVGGQGAAKQEPVLLHMLAQNIMQQQTQFGSQFPRQGGSHQGSPQVPQWPPQQLPQQVQPELPTLQQQLQQQAGLLFTQDFNDGSSSTSSMNSVQVPQLQSRPASVGQLIMPPMDVGSSPSSSRGARRGRSHSMGSMPRNAMQNRIAQQAQQAQRDSQGFAGQGFASMASLPSGSPGQWGQRAGLMRPPRTALPSPSPSPSPDRLPRLGHALEHTIYANPPEQTPSNPAAQLGLESQPYGDMLPDFPNPFQSHANRPWGPAVEPNTVFDSQLVQQPPQAPDTEPAPKRPKGPLSSQNQTPKAGPPSPTAQTQTCHAQGMTQRPLPQPLLSMQPSTLTQGSQQQPLPNQDLLSIAPLTSPRWMVYNEDPWAVGVPAFSAAAAEAALQQTHSGTGVQIPLQEQPASPYSPGQTAQPSQGSKLPGETQAGNLAPPATGTDAHAPGQSSHYKSGQRLQPSDEAQNQKAVDNSSHSGTQISDKDPDLAWLMGDANSWEGVFSFPADPPPAADTPHLPVPDRLSDEGMPLGKRQVRFASARALAPGLLQPVLEEGQVNKAEERQKIVKRSNALTSRGSLSLSQELVLRDCCFRWKRGVRNKQSAGSSSTMGGSSSRCARGFWRTDSQTRTVDSDMRSLMSLEDMSDLCQALPIEA
ncbi:TPA: PSII 6.1 kDa protein [Trebouxia sp. C0005]